MSSRKGVERRRGGRKGRVGAGRNGSILGGRARDDLFEPVPAQAAESQPTKAEAEREGGDGRKKTTRASQASRSFVARRRPR